ncbi:MAG: TIM barrel protein, partial [Deltaproteobacteria bacterium]
MKVSANLGFLWSDLPLLDRIDAAARAGFMAVETHQPFEVAPNVLKARCRDAGVKLLGINTAKGSQPGDQGLAAVPGRETEARALIKQAIDYAHDAGATAVHVLAG